ncbi:acetylcholine receptor subunit alpha-like 2 [Elysia marginata]|uniref:Acetylcholine receptor subunit alpha-like 2 n=1 Tax=Elysia marginata TaxID=1093978 RepID=A0AAV4H2N0_9GAST|nr:acetylcholine receptor subunit alpha-like 2 [Elysia marginata]
MKLSVFWCSLCIFISGYHVSASQGVTKDHIWEKMQWVRETAIPGVVPVQGGPLNVTLGLGLTTIRDVDIDRGEVEITAMRTVQWRDFSLSWLGKFSENIVSGINMNVNDLWSPDIVAYNAVHAPELLSPPLVHVSPDGSIMYVPHERIRFNCNLVNLETPGGANCTIKYGSWTYNGFLLHLQAANIHGFSLNDYMGDSRFEIMETYVEAETIYYPCCAEPYPDVKFTLNFRKKTSSESWIGWKK